MTYMLIPNIWYTITPETDCDINTPNGISIHLPAGIQYFHFADSVSIDISGTATVTQNPPLFKPASASVSGGGYIESNLNVGHGASAAVAAQCTLTPGADLDIGGTLEHDGSVVELEDQFAELDIAVSHPEYGGKLEVTDTGGQTLYTFDVPAEPGDFASIALTLAQGWELESIEFALDKGDGDTLELAYSWEGEFILADFADFLNSGAEGSLGNFAEAQTWGPGIKITLKDPAFAGTAGNAVSYASRTMSPFTNEDGETFSGGGENARDLAGLVEAMQDDDAPVEVEVNADNNGVLLTSKVGGADGAWNVVNAQGGDLWLGVDDTMAIANPRTLEDLAGAIEEDLTLMQLASASVSEGMIVLTAPTTPTATQYNNLEYTATGCFGGGTVKQGSTKRGKNAVAQTDYEIILNGNQPRPLTPTTTMKNGGVYTVAADIDARLVTLAANAKAEVRLTSGAVPLNVQWPAGWYWVDGSSSADGDHDVSPASLEHICTRAVIEVRNDGDRVAARVLYTSGVGGWNVLGGFAEQKFTKEQLDAFAIGDTSAFAESATNKCGADADGKLVWWGYDSSYKSVMKGALRHASATVYAPPRGTGRYPGMELHVLGGQARRVRLIVENYSDNPAMLGWPIEFYAAANSSSWDEGGDYVELQATEIAPNVFAIDTDAPVMSVAINSHVQTYSSLRVIQAAIK